MPTVVIFSDRIRLASLTADPTSVNAGDIYYRSDLARVRLAVDTEVGNVKTLPIAPITSDDINDGAITTAKIGDGQVTDAKIASGISPEKIATGNLNLGTGTVTCEQINVGDIILKHGWVIRERPDGIEIAKDGRVVKVIGESVFSKLKRMLRLKR
jgi:hypothetical protein